MNERNGWREMSARISPSEIAENAILAIGRGYDLCRDLRIKFCKPDEGDPYLIDLDHDHSQEISLPGNISVSNVSKSIKCDKGERTRFRSDVLPFQQMAEQFNKELSLTGKIPSGLFNSTFELSGSLQKDASNIRSLAFDGWFITLYTIALAKPQIVLRDHVKKSVPSTWDPPALTRFIEQFGTHVVVGVKMGGKDVVSVKQKYTSSLQAVEVQRRLKERADARFLDQKVDFSRNADEFKDKTTRIPHTRFLLSAPLSSTTRQEDLEYFYKRRGGNPAEYLSHSDWLSTIQSEPDVISMSFVPITSLLGGIPGNGFLNHAINLYLRYKPPIEDLLQFLEFQLSRQWAPVFGDFNLGPQRRNQPTASLQFSFMGPKLAVNTSWVDVGKRPVTGLRLYLEGKKSNRLAIHLQHLDSLPKILLLKDSVATSPPDSDYPAYYEPIQWRNFSHVCTAPVESDDDTEIVTGAQLHVGRHGMKKVLFLRLRFSKAINVNSKRNPDWAEPPGQGRKSGLISTFISTRLSTALQRAPVDPPAPPSDVITNSGATPAAPAKDLMMTKLVDTTELVRGPQDSPGYWVVTGARLMSKGGKISLEVKFSVLHVIMDDSE